MSDRGRMWPELLTGCPEVLTVASSHPIYASRILCLVGFGLAIANWLSVVACTVGAVVGFVVRIEVEVAAMLGAAGETYQEYVEGTKRLIPRVW